MEKERVHSFLQFHWEIPVWHFLVESSYFKTVILEIIMVIQTISSI